MSPQATSHTGSLTPVSAPKSGVTHPKTCPSWYKRVCADLSHAVAPLPVTKGPNEAAYAVFIQSSYLWLPGDVITYSYLPGEYQGTSIQQQKVDITAAEWGWYANVTFKRVDSGGTLRISFDEAGGSSSYIGTQNNWVSKDQRTMNLGWVEKTTTAMGAYEKGTILHEFGHAIGLLHEHQSPARTNVLTLNEEVVYNFYQQFDWDRAKVKQFVIDVLNVSELSNYSNLDMTSIMMYYMPAEFNLQHIDIPPNTVLSETDKAYAVLNYPRLTPNPNAKGWTIAHAVDVAGVTGTYRDQILKSQDPLEIRQTFSIWNITKKTRWTNGGSAGDVAAPVGSGNSSVSTLPLADRVDAILRDAKVPAATVDTIHAAITKELVLMSEAVAQRILQG